MVVPADVPPRQRFSARDDLSLQGGYLAVSRDIFDCQNQRRAGRDASDVLWVEARDATKHPAQDDSQRRMLHPQMSVMPGLTDLMQTLTSPGAYLRG